MSDISAKIKNIIDNSFFGVEIETCFSILDNSDVELDYEKSLLEYYYRLSKCSKKLPKSNLYSIAVNIDSEFTPINYDHWLLMPDASLSCSMIDDREDDYQCISNNKNLEIKKCGKYNFYPIEIITPKLSGRDGMSIIDNIWRECIMSEQFIYTSNTTQGLHVNISHPDMNTKNFIDWWMILEDEIISHLPDYRQVEIMDFAVPLKMLGNVYDMIREKYAAISIRNPDRIEVRVYGGTMNLKEIKSWTIFCLHVLAVSMVLKPQPADLDFIYQFIDGGKFWLEQV